MEDENIKLLIESIKYNQQEYFKRLEEIEKNYEKKVKRLESKYDKLVKVFRTFIIGICIIFALYIMGYAIYGDRRNINYINTNNGHATQTENIKIGDSADGKE